MLEIMTLSTLQEQSKLYSNWVTVSSVSDVSPVLKALDTHCKCGAEYAVSTLKEFVTPKVIEYIDNSELPQPIEVTKYTRVACVNPYCWIKQAYSLHHFISSLGFSGIGERTCLNLVSMLHDRFPYESFLSAFLLDDNDIYNVLKDHLTNVFLDIKDALFSSKWRMTDIIPALGIPGLGKRSKLFEVIDNPIVLVDLLLKPNGVSRILHYMDSNDSEFKAQFEFHKVDIVLLYSKIAPNFVQKPSKKVHIAITGSVSADGVNYSRTDFKSLCTSLCDSKGRQYYDIIETKAKSKLEYVIADSPSSSEKYIIGKQLGILVTAQEFIDLLRNSIPKEEVEEPKNNNANPLNIM